MADERTAGTIYDIGYQHYDGPRLGRANAIRTLIRFSFDAAFGTGRGQKAQAIPFIVCILVIVPAIMQIGMAAATGRTEVINYANHLEFTALFLALFVAAQAPELIVADRQYGVLPLYLSRSLRAMDYAFAKFGALVGAMLLLTLGAQLTLFIGRVLLSETPWQAFVDNWKTLGPIVGGSLLTACYMGAVGLALASFSARRAYATAGVIAFFVLLPAVAGIARQIVHGDAQRYAVLGNPFFVIVGFVNWLFEIQDKRRAFTAGTGVQGPIYFYVAAGTCLIALGVLLFRYRKAAE
jgi:ABC-2 type transport system permease protein